MFMAKVLDRNKADGVEADKRMAKLQGELAQANAELRDACNEDRGDRRENESRRTRNCRQRVEKLEEEITELRDASAGMSEDSHAAQQHGDQPASLGALALAALAKSSELRDAEIELAQLRDERIAATAEHTGACHLAQKLGAYAETSAMASARKLIERIDAKISEARTRLTAARRDFQPSYTRAISSVEAAHRTELASICERAAAIEQDLTRIVQFAQANGLEPSDAAVNNRTLASMIAEYGSSLRGASRIGN